MNRREQRKLYRKYLERIDIAIEGEHINECRIDKLNYLKLYITTVGVKSFYGLYLKRQLPDIDKKGRGVISIVNLQGNVVLDREITLKKLGI